MTRVRRVAAVAAILVISSPFGAFVQFPGAFGECPDVAPHHSPRETKITVCRLNEQKQCTGTEGTVVSWGAFQCELANEGTYCIGGEFAPCKWVGPCISVGIGSCFPNPLVCQYFDAQTKVAAACPAK
jgi:hypothetical protein